MPRGKRNDKAAVFAKMAAFLAEKNIEAPVVDQDMIDSIDDRDYKSNDGALLFAHHPPGFKPGVCKNCGAVYMVNRNAVGFCSDVCRREDWRKTTGLPWAAISTHDVWDGAPPHIISPEQIQKLAGIADWFSTNRTVLDTLAENWKAEQDEKVRQSLEDDLGIRVVLDRSIPKDLILVGDFDSMFGEPESDQSSNLQTNLPVSPSQSSLELSSEEASLFDF